MVDADRTLQTRHSYGSLKLANSTKRPGQVSCLGGTSMGKYKLFISHKHADAAIAKAVANFIRSKTLGQIDIHLSSDPSFRGPGIGGPLTEQLKQALCKTDALILVYTSNDKDWSYCMWECGVATDPAGSKSSIYVLQCGSDVPSPFAQDVRTNARSLDDIRKFTDTLLRGTFFPTQEQPLASGFERSEVFETAEELYKSLQNVLPPLGAEAIEEWSCWPRFKIALPATSVNMIKEATRDTRGKITADILRSTGIVEDADNQAAQIFGRGSIRSGTPFGELVTAWIEGSGDAAALWFTALAEQAASSLARNMVLLSRAPIRCLATGRNLTLFLSSVRRIAAESRLEFEIFLLDLVDPRIVPVIHRMIPIDSAFYIPIEDGSPTDTNLKEIRNQMTRSARSRVPILSKDLRPLYIVHLSMIDQYMLDFALNLNSNKRPDELIFSDILNDERFGPMFKNTFAVIPKTATVADAQLAMRNRDRNCRDAFVTEDGSADTSVLGWLTNVDAAL